jgi:type IV pilus assembly protein PilB
MKAKGLTQETGASRQQAVVEFLGTRKPMQIGEFLVRSGIVEQKDIEKALGIQRSRGGRLGSILVELHVCTEEAIRKALREQFGVEVVDLEQVRPNPNLLDLFSPEIIRKYEVIPLKVENDKLWVAMLDPYNLLALDDIRFRAGISRLVVTTCTEGDFRRFTCRNLPPEGVVEEILKDEDFYNRTIQSLSCDENYKQLLEEQATPLTAYQLQLATSESPIVTLCNFLLLEAIRWLASDIHIEPYENTLRVRIRVDGQLQTLINPPKKLAAAIVARLKVMAEMDITKHRVPQDGHLSVSCEGEAYHFRISTLPTIYGEKCVIRLLNNDTRLTSLEQLNLNAGDLAVLKQALAASQGLILVTGPTGSGKTTTVHAGLNTISHPSINIVTLEDPVEVTFFGINHVPVNRQGGMTFASGLRAILRQDPEVIFVGEMSDSEVAATVMQAAQTGHLVLSTLHTNSSLESIERLLDMGVPPYILASSLLLVIAQRLVRRVCELCAEPYALSEEEIAMLGIDAAQLATATPRIGHGCKGCMGTGYRGRVAIFEILQASREIKELLRRHSGPEELQVAARAAGTRTVFELGIEKVLRGETTVAEVRRALQNKV